ncbi:ATP-binding protein [Ferruginibacter yonginensis]|uniref:histidine kinase n=1 Tax=Ferruginibacter yonginensis TaxID=1310416 RepID=A0ABV8QM39_9BACT
MLKLSFALWFIIVTMVPTFAQKSAATLNIDSLKNLLASTKSEKEKVPLLLAIADYYQTNVIYDTAVQYKLEAVKVATTLLNKGDTTLRRSVVKNLLIVAESFLKTGQCEQALDYALQSRAFMQPTDVDYLVVFYKTAADALRMYAQAGAKKINEAEVYYDSLVQCGQKKYPEAWNKKIALDLAFCVYYLSLNDVDKALVYIKRADSLAPQFADPILASQVTYVYGSTYFTAKNYEKALIYLKEAEKTANAWSPDLYVELQRNIAQCYGAMGNYKMAFEYYEKFAPLRDSIYTKAAEKNYSETEAKFQNKEKQQQIELKNLQLAENKKQRYWLWGGIALLSLVALLLIIIYRNKKRTADILNTNNQQLATLNAALEDANQTKATLFSIIGHDLRSPISQVYQFLKLQQLNTNALSAEQKNELSTKIQSATGSLLESMEDLLIWSKTQMNAFKVDMQATAIAHITNQCCQLLSLNIEAKQLQIKNDIAPDASITTDSYYLQTIIRNLLQNAIKAAPDKSTVSINYHINEQGKIISINNFGTIFTQQQYEAAIQNTEAGKTLAGLGLRLVHELSQKINARVQFSNPATDQTTVHIIFE